MAEYPGVRASAGITVRPIPSARTAVEAIGGRERSGNPLPKS